MGSAGLDRTSGVPLYRQIMEILRDEIAEGVIDASEPMTEAKLISRFGVSLAPIRQALNELTREGVIYRQQGRGTFPVTGVRVDRPADLKTGDLYRYLADRGLHPTSRVSGIERTTPPSDVAERLNLDADEDLLHFTRLISVDDQPFAENDIYIRSPREFVPTEAELNDGGSALALLEQRHGLRLHHAEHEAWATAASSETADLLGVAEGSPLLVIDTVFRQADGMPVGWRRAVHRPEDFHFRFITNE